MKLKRHVRNHLIINMAVNRGRLHDAVQYEHAAKIIRIQNHDMLILGWLGKDHLFDPVANFQIVAVIFGEPKLSVVHMQVRG